MTPLRHLDCGDPLEARWVLDDAGRPCVVGWCVRCGYPPPDREASRAIEPSDIPPWLLLQAMPAPKWIQ